MCDFTFSLIDMKNYHMGFQFYLRFVLTILIHNLCDSLITILYDTLISNKVGHNISKTIIRSLNQNKFETSFCF